LILILLWPRSTGNSAGPEAGNLSLVEGSGLFFSPYCVVFPTEGTIDDNVKSELDKMFPKKVIWIDPDESRKRLHDKLMKLRQSLDGQGKQLHALLAELKDKEIDFKGYTQGKSDSFDAIIEREASFPTPA